MDDEIHPQTQDRADFGAARLKAFFRSVVAYLLGQRNELLSYDAVREKLRVGGPIYRGLRTVLVKNIVGSVNRYRDFDRAFLPTQSFTADRWLQINRAFYLDVSLPPIVLYKVGEVYFVVDGNHRVSVPRERSVRFHAGCPWPSWSGWPVRSTASVRRARGSIRKAWVGSQSGREP